MALKVGMVGMNGIGYSHAPTHTSDALADLVAICDVVKERADKAAEQYGCKAYYSLEDMLANEELDIVDVTTGGLENGSWHYEPAMRPWKPARTCWSRSRSPATSTRPARWSHLAAEMDVYLGCNLNHYFTPPAAKAKEYMNEGKLGELVYCLCQDGLPGRRAGQLHRPRAP